MSDTDQRILLPEHSAWHAEWNDERQVEDIVFDKGKSRYVSDGYHTFDELYDFRMLYNALLFNQWAIQDKKDQDDGIVPQHAAHKSWKHFEGEDCFGGGWFIVVAYVGGKQISNHYKAEHWDLFKLPVEPRADKWDGHTPQDVADRMRQYLMQGDKT